MIVFHDMTFYLWVFFYNNIGDKMSKFKTKKKRESAIASDLYYHKIYYLKNLYVLQYQAQSSIGESYWYYLLPKNSSLKNKKDNGQQVSKYLITRSSVEASPISK